MLAVQIHTEVRLGRPFLVDAYHAVHFLTNMSDRGLTDAEWRALNVTLGGPEASDSLATGIGRTVNPPPPPVLRPHQRITPTGAFAKSSGPPPPAGNVDVFSYLRTRVHHEVADAARASVHAIRDDITSELRPVIEHFRAGQDRRSRSRSRARPRLI